RGRQVCIVPREPARIVPERAGQDAAAGGRRDEEPLRDAARREGARDASSGAADDDAADDRAGAASDASDAGADGAAAAGGAALMPAPAPRFSADTLTFLKGLKRNNRREWFNARKDVYEAHVREPMTTVVERLADDFRSFAPEL